MQLEKIEPRFLDVKQISFIGKLNCWLFLLNSELSDGNDSFVYRRTDFYRALFFF